MRIDHSLAGSAYSIVRSTSQFYRDGKVRGIRTPNPLNNLTKKLALVTMSAMTLHVPKLKTHAPLEIWRHMREIPTSHDF